MNRIYNIVGLVVLLLFLSGCTEQDADSLRSQLTYPELMALSETPTIPVDNSMFREVTASNALHTFSGYLEFTEHVMATSPSEIQPAEIAGKQTQLFPAVRLGFVDRDGYLVPIDRNLIRAEYGDSFWQVQVEPGRVWSEAADHGMSRAAFPFMLTSDIENESYNGVATFLYNNEEVSELRYQIVQQTSPYLVRTRFTAWGQVAVGYEPQKVPGSIAEEFAREMSDRLPVHDWSVLVAEFGDETLQGFTGDIDPAETVAAGLYFRDGLYVQPSLTPFGDYPFPDEMRHGIWSVTKTAAGMVTMLRMAQKYGDEIFDYRIADYVNVTASHNGWQAVTFGHALSMATGIGTGSENVEPNNISDGYIESDQEAYDAWYLAPSNLEKQQLLFQVPNHSWGPGVHARYRDRDIYVLSAALDALLKSKEGAQAELWQMMMDEVFRPIGIHHLPKSHTKESDGSRGVPFLAWGLYLTADDTAKISRLLMNGGQHDGEQLLSVNKLAEAMYQTEIRGLPTGESNSAGDGSYHMTFWHAPYRTQSGQVISIPQMQGWGGNVVMLMPNGTMAYRFGNGGYADDEPAIGVAERLQAFD